MAGASMFDFQPGQAEAMVRGIASAVGRRRPGSRPPRRACSARSGATCSTSTRPVDQLAPMSAAELAAALDPVLARGAVRGMVDARDRRRSGDARARGARRQLREDARGRRAHAAGGARLLARVRWTSRSRTTSATRTCSSTTRSTATTARCTGRCASPATAARSIPRSRRSGRRSRRVPPGSLGRTVWDFYQRRGFSLPGSPGSVDPLLAQHDFVHCVADYGTSATGEIEVFSFIAASIPDASGLQLPGRDPRTVRDRQRRRWCPGVATASPGHLQLPGGTERMGDAIRRGLLLGRDVMGGVDWFEYVDDPLDDVRSKLGIVPKSDDAIAAGSLSAMTRTRCSDVELRRRISGSTRR